MLGMSVVSAQALSSSVPVRRGRFCSYSRRESLHLTRPSMILSFSYIPRLGNYLQKCAAQGVLDTPARITLLVSALKMCPGVAGSVEPASPGCSL